MAAFLRLMLRQVSAKWNRGSGTARSKPESGWSHPKSGAAPWY